MLNGFQPRPFFSFAYFAIYILCFLIGFNLYFSIVPHNLQVFKCFFHILIFFDFLIFCKIFYFIFLLYMVGKIVSFVQYNIIYFIFSNIDKTLLYALFGNEELYMLLSRIFILYPNKYEIIYESLPQQLQKFPTLTSTTNSLCISFTFYTIFIIPIIYP